MNSNYSKRSLYLLITLTLGLRINVSADTQSLNETTDGITFTQGVFYPTHSIQGMVYNTQTQSYQMPPSGSGETGGGAPQTQSLPDPEPLLNEYNSYTTVEAKKAYFAGLLSPQKASLFGELSSEDQAQMMGSFAFDTSSHEAFSTSKGLLKDFLSQLPSGEAGPALNMLDPYAGRVYIGAPDYYGSTTYGPLQGLDLSGLNLTGLVTTGKKFDDTNLSGTTGFTASMFNEASGYFQRANLSGLNLSGYDFTGKAITSANLANSNITGTQLAQVANQNPNGNWSDWYRNLNLSGVQTLGDWDTTGRDLTWIDFTGSNISTAQISAANNIDYSDFSGVNLSGLNLQGKGITGTSFSGALNFDSSALNNADNLERINLAGLNLNAWNTTGKNLESFNLSGSTITMAQLEATRGRWGNTSEGLVQANLSNMDLTGLNTSGKSLGSVNFVGSTISVAQLNNAQSITYANLSGTSPTNKRDLTGLELTAKGVPVNLANTTITPEQLVQASNWTPSYMGSGGPSTWIDLRGTGITKAQLTSALETAGRTGDPNMNPDWVIYE